MNNLLSISGKALDQYLSNLKSQNDLFSDIEHDYFDDRERIAVFIDGQSFYHSMSSLGKRIDYDLVRNFFKDMGRVVALNYYTVVINDQTALYHLITWLKYHGYSVTMKEIPRDENRSYRSSASTTVDLVVDALQMVDYVDHFVFVAGDGNLVRVVETLKSRGKRVTVIGTSNEKSYLSDQLRQAATQTLDTKLIAGLIENTRTSNRVANDANSDADDVDDEDFAE